MAYRAIVTVQIDHQKLKSKRCEGRSSHQTHHATMITSNAIVSTLFIVFCNQTDIVPYYTVNVRLRKGARLSERSNELLPLKAHAQDSSALMTSRAIPSSRSVCRLSMHTTYELSSCLPHDVSDYQRDSKLIIIRLEELLYIHTPV